MQIKQWKDEPLAHFSYAILLDDEKKMIMIDPARDPTPYLGYAKEHQSAIIAIIETHPHADFISGHLELSQLTGANIYAGSLAGASYPHIPLDDGHQVQFGNLLLTALHTPGHSPDSICILLEKDDKQLALFSGDTLFVGDCGRPDLRTENGDAITARLNLATAMYYSLRNKLSVLNDEVLLYPAHGAGSLCGKALSEAPSSTMGVEKKMNWSLQEMNEAAFVDKLLKDQPFVPAYFSHAVDLNQKGAAPFAASVGEVKIGVTITTESNTDRLDAGLLIVDARNEKFFKKGHLSNSVNIMAGLKFDTWLGSIIQPGESFYLAGDTPEQINQLVRRVAAIGYEQQIKEAFVVESAKETVGLPNLTLLKENADHYTIVDVRNEPEVREKKIFQTSLAIPLHELRSRVDEIPTGKPILVHCAGGYRSAVGSSLLEAELDEKVMVYDLGEAVKNF